MKKLIILLCVLCMLLLSSVAQKCDSCVQSYDTTYVDARDSSLVCRQQYINDIMGKQEIFILKQYRNDSLIKTYKWINKYGN